MLHNSIPVVMYHHVSPVGKELNVTPEILEDHLKVLRQKGWKTLRGDEFLYFLQSKEIPRKCVLLTFDDGFVDNYLFAYPLLNKYKMKAMLFAATAFIEDIDIKRDYFIPLTHKESWRLALTERRSEVMCTWNELKEMEVSELFDIQSHGHSHKTPEYMKENKYAELKKDLLVSKSIMERRLSKEVLHLAWPKGHYDQMGINIATDAGFKALYTTERGTNTDNNLYELKRLPVKYKDGKWLIGKLRIYSSVSFTKLYLTLRTGI